VQELLALGKARRSLGQKQSQWTEQTNNRLVYKMDVNGDGVIRVDEFVQYFAQSLPDAKPEFDAVIRQFLEVAHSFRITKLKEQGVESTAPDPNEELRAQLAELTREVSTLLSQKAAAEDEVVQQPPLGSTSAVVC
jgi:hypothetical protein